MAGESVPGTSVTLYEFDQYNDLHKYKIVDLHRWLKCRGLQTVGNKDEIVQRVKDARSSKIPIDPRVDGGQGAIKMLPTYTQRQVVSHSATGPSTTQTRASPVATNDDVDALERTVKAMSLSSVAITFDEIMRMPGYNSARSKEKFIFEKMKLTAEVIKATEEATRDQRTNKYWSDLRVGRLTASNFGKILKAIGRNRFPPCLFKTLLGEYGACKTRAIMWGVENEPKAMDAFEADLHRQRKNDHIQRECGIYLHSSGLLGASPDGLIDETGLIEIKCPFSKRDKMIAEAITEDSKFYVKVGASGELYLDTKHDYYYQIQGQLYMANRDYCMFVVWTTVDLCVIRVEKDPSWEPNIGRLLKFYEDEFLPRLLDRAQSKQ